MVSKRITSAPTWASVSPPRGAATKADPSKTRSPLSSPIGDQTARSEPGLHEPRRVRALGGVALVDDPAAHAAQHLDAVLGDGLVVTVRGRAAEGHHALHAGERERVP